VSLLDIAPTVLELVGLAPRGEMDGRSLADVLRSRPGGGASRLEAELANQPKDYWLMHREGDHKLIERWDPSAAAARASWAQYAIEIDPHETLELGSGEQSP